MFNQLITCCEPQLLVALGVLGAPLENQLTHN